MRVIDAAMVPEGMAGLSFVCNGLLHSSCKAERSLGLHDPNRTILTGESVGADEMCNASRPELVLGGSSWSSLGAAHASEEGWSLSRARETQALGLGRGSALTDGRGLPTATSRAVSRAGREET